MKVNLYIATHERPRITRKCFNGVVRIRKTFASLGIYVTPIIAVSDEPNRKLCEEYGFESHEIPYTPIGRRMNELITKGDQDYDYLMQLGSDDIIDDELCYILAGWMKAGAGIFGVSSMNIVNCYTGEIRKVSQKLVFGAGRCIRRDLVLRTGQLWGDNLISGLDGDSQTRVFRATGVGCQTVSTPRPMLWDIKSNVNLHRWDKFDGAKQYEPEQKPIEL